MNGQAWQSPTSGRTYTRGLDGVWRDVNGTSYTFNVGDGAGPTEAPPPRQIQTRSGTGAVERVATGLWTMAMCAIGVVVIGWIFVSGLQSLGGDGSGGLQPDVSTLSPLAGVALLVFLYWMGSGGDGRRHD